MIITKELLKSEIDKVPESYFDILYRIIQALINPLELIAMPFHNQQQESWSSFVAETYGCLADDPIERGEQGQFEIREVME
jgi:hypothetical protein